MTGAELLRRFLESFDVRAFAEAIGPDLIAEARADVPELAFLSDQALANVLGSAACEGVTRLVQSAELKLDVEGLGPDPAIEALSSTVEAVRTALGLLAPEQPDEPDRAERERRAYQALDLMASLVQAWDEGQARG